VRQSNGQPVQEPTLRRPWTWLLAQGVRGYRRWLSPLLPPACRFHPSCSHYALLALSTHRLPRALWLILTRLLRCQPLCRGGEDWPPVGPFGSASPRVSTDRSLHLPRHPIGPAACCVAGHDHPSIRADWRAPSVLAKESHR
jgi:putative membrane protein insertion efficiency factor